MNPELTQNERRAGTYAAVLRWLADLLLAHPHLCNDRSWATVDTGGDPRVYCPRAVSVDVYGTGLPGAKSIRETMIEWVEVLAHHPDSRLDERQEHGRTIITVSGPGVPGPVEISGETAEINRVRVKPTPFPPLMPHLLRVLDRPAGAGTEPQGTGAA